SCRLARRTAGGPASGEGDGRTMRRRSRGPGTPEYREESPDDPAGTRSQAARKGKAGSTPTTSMVRWHRGQRSDGVREHELEREPRRGGSRKPPGPPKTDSWRAGVPMALAAACGASTPWKATGGRSSPAARACRRAASTCGDSSTWVEIGRAAGREGG